MTWNSTLSRTAPLRSKAPMKRTKKSTKEGVVGKSALLRSEVHRRNVASLACAVCGRNGPSQCAHINFSKGLALKADDSLTFPACHDCHRNHDSGGMSRMERIKREWQYVDHTRALLIRRNQWPAAVEEHYQRAIKPLARMVHGNE